MQTSAKCIRINIISTAKHKNNSYTMPTLNESLIMWFYAYICQAVSLTSILYHFIIILQGYAPVFLDKMNFIWKQKQKCQNSPKNFKVLK